MNKRQEKMLEDAIAILEKIEQVERPFNLGTAEKIHEAIGLIYLAVKHEAKLVR